VNTTELAASITSTQEDIELLYERIDTVWLIITIACIFLMQLGFLLLEAGTLTDSHKQTIILKNITDASFGAAAWYLVGYWIYSSDEAYGVAAAVVPNDTSEFLGWFQSYVFAVTTATILSGGVACRIKFSAYVVYSTLLSAWIYPILARWAWGDGFLAARGFQDFAGSGPVHLLGGISALIGTIALGPRKYRFAPDGRDNAPQGSSTADFVTGAFILWFGWFSFNAGSSGGLRGESNDLAIRAAMNTLVASAMSGITGVTISLLFFRNKVMGVVINGILGGLVGITAGCCFVSTGGAIIIGFLSPLICVGASSLLIKLRVDDPLDASAVHGFCGFFGVVMVGLLDPNAGLLYGHGGALFATQLIGAFTCTGWGALHAILFFFPLRKFIRVSVEKELAGLDADYFERDDTLDATRIKEHNEVKTAQKALAARKKKKSSAVHSTSSASGSFVE
jgi:Amt family ammonium transporter